METISKANDLSKASDLLRVAGDVEIMRFASGIRAYLPDWSMTNEKGNYNNINKIAYFIDESGRGRVLTYSWRVTDFGREEVRVGDPSIPEIIAFAEKAKQDLPDYPLAEGLIKLGEGLKTLVDSL